MKLFCWCVWGFWIAFHLPVLWVAKAPAVWGYYQLLFLQLSGFANLSLNDFMFNDFVQRTQLSFKPDFQSSIIFTVFVIQTHKLVRHLVISLKTQLDFFFPFPYNTTKKHSVESETTAILAVAVAESITSHNGRVVRCVKWLTRTLSSQQCNHMWSENRSCKKSRREPLWHLQLFILPRLSGAKTCQFTLLVFHK